MRADKINVLCDYMLEKGIDPNNVSVLRKHGIDNNWPHMAWKASYDAWVISISGDDVMTHLINDIVSKQETAIAILTGWVSEKVCSSSHNRHGYTTRSFLAYRVRKTMKNNNIGTLPKLLAPDPLWEGWQAPGSWILALYSVKDVLTSLKLWEPSPFVKGNIAHACPECGGPLLHRQNSTHDASMPTVIVSCAWRGIAEHGYGPCTWRGAVCTVGAIPSVIKWSI